MSIQFQLRRGTTSQIAAITPADGEPIWDQTVKGLVVGDGSTAGGIPQPSRNGAIYSGDSTLNNIVLGKLWAGTTNGSAISGSHAFVAASAIAHDICTFYSSTTSSFSMNVSASDATPGWNAANSSVQFGKVVSTSRSINASGTINASGADLAEYKTKRSDCGNITPGFVCGLDGDGHITDKWSLLKLARVKSGAKGVQPAVIMGDAWGTAASICITDGQPLGDRPLSPSEDDPDYAVKMAALPAAIAAFNARLEANRSTVDRLAYCGTVFVLLDQKTGARTPEAGDYIVLCEGDADTIAWEAVAVGDMTFAQTHMSIGRVERLDGDGTPLVSVSA